LIAWLGLGSNLGEPVAQVRDAITRLASVDGLEVVEVSGLYRTPPWGDEDQADFINAVVRIETLLAPLPLLTLLQTIENEMGRQRTDRRWGPRLIDIDLLLYGSQQFHSENLEIPHPRMHERAFVLLPVCELDKTINIPGHGKAEQLLKRLDCSGIFRLDKDEIH